MLKESIKEKLDNWSICDYKDIICRISSYNVISFDVFDTLIKRDVPNPQDVFKMLERKTGIDGLSDLRIEAEIKAREVSKNQEVGIKDIYNELGKILKNSQTELNHIMETEIGLEEKLCVVNLDMLPIYNYCINNKIVVLISDMYLKRETIESILNKNHIANYRKLYISNEINKTKISGELFQFVKKDLGIENIKIMHIGNSFNADFIKAHQCGYGAIKISTYYNRKQREDAKNVTWEQKCLNTFINNHVQINKDFYQRFGFECFGPVLYGFTKWLYYNMNSLGIQNVLFLARDGYIMKRTYDMLGLNENIPSYYFESSRRSLRIPCFNPHMKYEEILDELTVPNMTNMAQLFDSLGLNADDYKELIKEYGFNFESQIKRDTLKNNISFKQMYENIKNDIFENVEREQKNLYGYIRKFPFDSKLAIVDIGWGGSMQKYLIQTLNKMGIICDITGFYFGLTKKAKENLGKNNYRAYGYTFDCLNNDNDSELESAFIGLYETLFLEQNGSVKRYVNKNNNFYAERYVYEYENNGVKTKEALNVDKIHQGALLFCKTYDQSIMSDLLKITADGYFSHLYRTGINPTKEELNHFGEFEFFNCGSKVFLAKPREIKYYLHHYKDLKKDIYDAQWKIGFLKRLLKIKLPYNFLFQILSKIANR